MNPARGVEARPEPEALSAFLSALQAFETAPGRFALVLHEPRKVFEHLRLVLQLAAGRAVEAHWPPEEEAKARQAARFFVRTAMLRPGADHYTLLGLAPGFEPEALKDHYRMMIRLTHPDFVSPADPWPADAAARINIANTVLTSPTERESYTAQLLKDREGQTSLAAPPAGMQNAKQAKVRGPRVTALCDMWMTPKVKAWAMGLGVLVCLTGLMLANPTVEDRTLKARSPAATAEDDRSSTKTTEQMDIGNALAKDLPAVARPDTTDMANKRAFSEALERPAMNPKPMAVAMPAARQALQKVPAPLPPVLFDTAPSSLTAPDWPMPSTERSGDEPMIAAGTAAAQKSTGPATEPASKAQGLSASIVALASPTISGQPAGAASQEAPLTPAGQGALVTTGSPAEAPVQQLAKAEQPSSAAKLRGSVSADGVRSVMQGLAKVLESGRGRNAYPYLAPESRNTDATLKFVRAYQDALKGQKVLKINKTQWVSADDGEGWLVKGTYELVLEDYPGSSYVKNLTLQARFVERQGSTVLTRLTLLSVAESAR